MEKPRIKKNKNGTSETTEKSPCHECEQVNVVPVRETGCVDDVVKNGEIYYYVAIAINRGGISFFSNQTRAEIPSSKKPLSVPTSSYPFCRTQQADAPPAQGIR